MGLLGAAGQREVLAVGRTILLNPLVGREGMGWGAQRSGLCRLERLGFRAW